jgi:hypothetical protein
MPRRLLVPQRFLVPHRFLLTRRLLVPRGFFQLHRRAVRAPKKFPIESFTFGTALANFRAR